MCFWTVIVFVTIRSTRETNQFARSTIALTCNETSLVVLIFFFLLSFAAFGFVGRRRLQRPEAECLSAFDNGTGLHLFSGSTDGKSSRPDWLLSWLAELKEVNVCALGTKSSALFKRRFTNRTHRCDIGHIPLVRIFLSSVQRGDVFQCIAPSDVIAATEEGNGRLVPAIGVFLPRQLVRLAGPQCLDWCVGENLTLHKQHCRERRYEPLGAKHDISKKGLKDCLQLVVVAEQELKASLGCVRRISNRSGLLRRTERGCNFCELSMNSSSVFRLDEAQSRKMGRQVR